LDELPFFLEFLKPKQKKGFGGKGGTFAPRTIKEFNEYK